MVVWVLWVVTGVTFHGFVTFLGFEDWVCCVSEFVMFGVVAVVAR